MSYAGLAILFLLICVGVGVRWSADRALVAAIFALAMVAAQFALLSS
jgi:phage shock protein PspC (stress-responsive transcriptional regulator)